MFNPVTRNEGQIRASRLQRLLITVALFACCVSTSVSASALAIDGADWDSLSRGKVLIRQQAASSGQVPSVEARILISRPPEKVWKVVADPEKLMQEENKVKKVKILSRGANRQNVAFSVSMTRFFPPFNYVLLQELSPPSLLKFRRISGSFKDIQGSWRLSPVENGSKTVLTYTLRLDPGPLIPRSLLLGAVKSDLPEMMRNARTAIYKN